MKPVETLHGLNKSVLEFDEFMNSGVIGNFKNFLLGLIQEFFEFTRLVKAKLADMFRRINKPTHHVFLLDDLAVMLGVGRRGNRAHHFRENSRSAYLFENTFFFKTGRE